MKVYEYRIDEGTEKVHMVEQAWPERKRTLCGKSTETMRRGDETQSGIAATCERCRAKLNPITNDPGLVAADKARRDAGITEVS
jgi:predicted nucleic acid-binding Zn ribbon protein